MLSEPYKIKEVKHLPQLRPHERWNLLNGCHFNTFHIDSAHVTFDLVARGMSSWSHFQKAAYMVGDEAYAGSRNFLRLRQAAVDVFGFDRLVPTHNGIGAEKLLASTMIRPGQIVLHNRGRDCGLVSAHQGCCVDITASRAGRFADPAAFGANADLDHLARLLDDKGRDGIAYIHIETCPDGWNCQPIALGNLREIQRLARSHGVPLAIDASNVMENAYWVSREEPGEKGELIETARAIADLADVLLMDASQDCRADVGGLVTSRRDELFEKLRNQVVVFEGLHTYGGMTGRAMEVFAVGMTELLDERLTEWYANQTELFWQLLSDGGIPAFRSPKGVGLDVAAFLPHLKAEDYPKFALAACLYVHGGLRPRIDGDWAFHAQGEGRRILSLELPRHAYTRNHLHEIADTVSAMYASRAEIRGLRLLNDPRFVDQACFEPENQRLLVTFPTGPASAQNVIQPYKIAIFEPITLQDREHRWRAIERAGYNTFLLDSEDVYIDLLTDSGTSAMSCYQWEGMTNTNDTPYSSRHYYDFVRDFREILGYKHILPTHQGRAAEHIMSQVMVRKGQSVPGNMYFTTTKLHQEMAGGVFVDVITDEAHNPESSFPWKGNIDLAKLEAEIKRAGDDGVAYVSFETAVNMAGGQPFSMENVRAVSKLCQKHNIPVMFDATRCVENAYMIQLKDPAYASTSVKEILRELLSYGDGCTISCKKDFLVNMGGLLACNNDALAEKFEAMLRVWEGDITNGGLDPKDIEALRRGLWDSLDDHYIRARVQQTQEFGRKLIEGGVPIVNPPGTHAIFLDARRFLPHVDQDEYPAQALAAAIYVETGVRTMERGNVSKGRDPVTKENYRPALELVRCTIPRRVYSGSHIDFVVDGIVRLYQKRDGISGLRFTYEPQVLRFFQGRFEPLKAWEF